jgi:phosphatidylserine decarboxylase
LEEEGILVMSLDIFASSILVALVFLPLFAWKWRVRIWIGILAGIAIGSVTGFVVFQIDLAVAGLNMAALVLIELFFILMITILIIIARFYRDPKRIPIETKNVILAPADGRVVYVNRVEKGSSLISTKGGRKFKLEEITTTNLLADATFLIGIDMNLLDVHINRSPIAGKAILQKHIKGRFMSLRKEESEILNERVSTIIDNGAFRVGIVRIASRLVRRIVSYIREGDSVEIGQRIGAIVFGSQVDVAIPELENLRIEVKSGDKTKAGVSIIARYS